MVILEGTDGVGKTSTIKALKDFDLQDRDKFISKYMDFNISLEKRAKLYYDYLKNRHDIVIFLINNDKEELERRVYSREVIDEYDCLTYLYNLLYLETYLYMENKEMLNNKLFLINTTNMTIEDMALAVKKIIENKERKGI